ncbi:MAG: Na/Pi symporter [Victivallaceae bacterium]
MQTRQDRLRRELFDIQKQLVELDREGETSGKLKKDFAKLSERRNRLEEELIDEIVAAEDPYRADAWDGFKQGLVKSLKSFEKSLKKSTGRKKSEPSLVDRSLKVLTVNPYLAWSLALLMVYLLLLAVGCLGGGFKWIAGGTEGAKQLFDFATNPFMGLIVGMLATALIQSSSTTTSIIVALCAAGMPIEAAIPMVMGANIGTSVTNTLVSLGHIGNRAEFKRAFSAATVHDFFNLLAVAIFLPLEIVFHPLAKLSGCLTDLLYGSNVADMSKLNPLKFILSPAEKGMQTLFKMLPVHDKVAAFLFILFGLFLIFCSILMLGKILRVMMTGRAEKLFHAAVGRSPLAAIASGMGITVLVQSSSTTTSLIVPLAGAGVMTLPQIYPFTLGANIGTCVTALMAAMAITGAGAAPALQIALVHFLFNTLGVALIYGIRLLRNLPLYFATVLGKVAAEHKSLALIYIIGVFFVLPGVCLGVYKLFEPAKEIPQHEVCPTCGRQK